MSFKWDTVFLGKNIRFSKYQLSIFINLFLNPPPLFIHRSLIPPFTTNSQPTVFQVVHSLLTMWDLSFVHHSPLETHPSTTTIHLHLSPTVVASLSFHHLVKCAQQWRLVQTSRSIGNHLVKPWTLT